MRTIESCAAAERYFAYQSFLAHLADFLVKNHQVLNAQTFFSIGVPIASAESSAGCFHSTTDNDVDSRFYLVNFFSSDISA